MDERNSNGQGATKLTIWNRTFICVFIAQAFLSLSQGSVNILIARYATEALGVSEVAMGNLVGLYYGVSLAMRPVTGPLQTKLNKRNLLIAVYFTGGIANLGYALFNTAAAFTTFRIIQGIQYAFMGSLTMTIAADSLPQERLASGIAMYGLGGTIMQAIAPNIGIWIRDRGPGLKPGLEGVTYGYQLAFFFAACILAFAVIPLLMLPYKKEKKEETETTGAWYKNIISLHTIPITIVVILINISTSGYRSFLDAFAHQAGIPNIGLFSTVSAIVMVCTRPMSGYIMDHYSMKKILPAGMAMIGLALVVISNSRTLPIVLIGAVFSALGSGFVQPGLNALCVQTETPRRRAVASNTLFGGTDLGLYVGPLVGGAVVARSNYSMAILSGLLPLTMALVCFFAVMPGYTRRQKEIERLMT
ncbi:MAG: MFS transporter [Clostridiales bacterium]|nr:MFS transporter [Clostridiales bacterium]